MEAFEMKRTIIITNENSITNYSIKIIDGDNIEIKDITDIVDNGKTLKLPENPSGRKYWAIKKMTADEVELTEKSATPTGVLKKSPSPRGTSTLIRVSAKLAEHLTEEEMSTIKDIIGKAEARMNSPEAKQAQELEKLRKQAEKYRQQYEELLAKSQEGTAE